MQPVGSITRGSSSSGRRQQQSAVCQASGQLNRPTHNPTPQGRPQLPPQQQQQQQQQHHAQDQLLHPSPSSSSSRLQQQGQLRPGQQPLLSRPSRSGLTPLQQLAAARRFDDSDTRMAAYDSLVVQVLNAVGVWEHAQAATSFNRGPCKMQRFMAAGMKGASLQRPTPLQGALMTAIYSGRDVLSAAPPGAGSSTAALLGVLNQLLGIPRSMPPKKAWPLALLLCPSRELALQQAALAAKLVAGSQLTVRVVTGGSPLAQQALAMRKGCDLLVATPGRLNDLVGRYVNLARLKYLVLGVLLLVLEEVDELMGPALLPLTKQLLHHATMPPHTQRQTIALGSSALPQQQLRAAAVDVVRPTAVLVRATWPSSMPATAADNPQQQQQQQQQLPEPPNRRAYVAAPVFARLLADPSGALSAAAAATAAAVSPALRQQFLGVAPQLRQRTLLRLLSGDPAAAAAAAAAPGSSSGSSSSSSTPGGFVSPPQGSVGAGGGTGSGGPTVVFTNSAAAADEVVAQLEAAGVAAGALHHGRSQAQREEALQCFRFGVTQVLVACGPAFRGLDLRDVSLVVNYEVPLSLAEYARRAGVAGRQGLEGVVVTLVVPRDAPLVPPLVALLGASGQAVPDWLAALAAGGSSSSGEGDGGVAAAAGGGGAAGSRQPSQQQQQQQQQQGSWLHTVVDSDLEFGGYNSSSRRGRGSRSRERSSSSSSSRSGGNSRMAEQSGSQPPAA